MAQSGERLVDLGSFLQSVSGSTCLGDSLTTSQIHHVKLTGSDMLFAIGTNLGSFNLNLEQ